MTSHVDSSPSLTPSQESSGLPSEIAEAFLSWQPTVPSSWVTPPGSDGAGTPNSPRSDDSSPIRQDYYVPQMLIYTPDNLHLHAAHTPYSAPTALDAEDTPATPQPTPSPAPHQSQSPTPTPTPSPSHHTQRLNTLWDPYIQTHGHKGNPLYHSPTPHRHKKPKKYKPTLEEKCHQEQQALIAQLTHGRMLTRGLLGKIMGSHQQRGSS